MMDVVFTPHSFDKNHVRYEKDLKSKHTCTLTRTRTQETVERDSHVNAFFHILSGVPVQRKRVRVLPWTTLKFDTNK